MHDVSDAHKRLRPSRLDTCVTRAKTSFVSLLEFIRSKFSFFLCDIIKRYGR